MLSPGQYYRQVPRDLNANLAFRKHVLDRCNANPKYRNAVLEMCRDDLPFYVNTFVWQENPKRIGKEIEPFVLWPYQDRAFRVILSAVEDQEDLCIEKSREMGATWMCLITQDWFGKFDRNKHMGVVSRDADAVDDGTMNSLLPKLDFISQNQPEWLTGEISKKVKGMLRRYERTRGDIAGEASTGKAFVSGRLFWLFVDEFSQITEGYKVQQRTHDVAACRIFNFTHVGATGHAYELSRRPDIRKLVMHWSEHPRKNPGLYRYDPEKGRVVAVDKSYFFATDFRFVTDGTPAGGPYPGLRSPWYDKECERRASSRAVAEDLDIDPAGSTRQFFDQMRLDEHKRQFCIGPFWTGELQYDYASAQPRGLVESNTGALSLWIRPDEFGRPPKARYVVSCDPAAGTGATNSTMCIGDRDRGEQVGEYAFSKIYPDQFARMAVAMSRLFQDKDGDGAILCWEVQGAVGETFGQNVAETGYSRLYHNYDCISRHMVGKPGWTNTIKTLPVLLRDFEGAVYSGQYVVRSEYTIDECKMFQFMPTGKVEHTGFAKGEKDDPSGAQSNHGDRAMSAAQNWMVMKTDVRAAQEKEPEKDPEPEFMSFEWRRRLRHQTDDAPWLGPVRRNGPLGVTVWSAANA